MDILFDVPQGSKPGILLFNIFLRDLLLFVHVPVVNYANENNPFCTGLKTWNDLIKLEHSWGRVSNPPFFIKTPYIS